MGLTVDSRCMGLKSIDVVEDYVRLKGLFPHVSSKIECSLFRNLQNFLQITKLDHFNNIPHEEIIVGINDIVPFTLY